MNTYIKKVVLICSTIIVASVSCTKKLDLFPTNDQTAENVYKDIDGYKKALAKVYGAYALISDNGADVGSDAGDVKGINAGFSDFFRLFWKAQELTTDEAVVAWKNDEGLLDLHNMNWGADNQFTKGLYYRSIYQITLANDYIRQSAPSKLASRGISIEDAKEIAKYAAEVRFLRAYQYWVLMDVFGNPPFVTEADLPGAFLPKQISRSDLFTYVESELKAIEPMMVNARLNEYGRADRAACRSLLARMYLNAKVYIGKDKYTEAITYSSKVIDSGYSLVQNYGWLMLADNHLNTTENILTIPYDGIRTQNYGGTTMFTHGSLGGSMNDNDFGVNGKWGGFRTTPEILANLYPQYKPDNPPNFNSDTRAQFYWQGQTRDIADITNFTSGFAVTKFKNKTRTGANGSNPTFVDIDMPLFRVAEQYLIYAEAILRGGAGGNQAKALTLVNDIRNRAYGNTSGAVATLDLNLILDERGRELFWEGHRRTDLIRYDKFVEDTYVWQWKGGVKSGVGVSSHRKLFPLPVQDLNVNSNLKQNTGY
jgi:starch-binding outer membrane protein, SusD/RagB family